MPGFVRVVSKGNYVAVVCEREEQAIRAARQLKVELEAAGDGAVPVVREPVHLHARREHRHRRASRVIDAAMSTRALAGAATVVEAKDDVPFEGQHRLRPRARASLIDRTGSR